MATSPFSNPLLESTGVSDVPRPFAPWTPTSDMGIGGLAPSLADMAVTGERLVKASQFTMPEMRKPTRPNLGFSPTTNELFVNGLQFSADDAATALQSEQYLGAAPKPLPSGDWIPLNEAQYGQYLQSIRKPSLGQLASKSFGRGVDAMQMLAGRGLQLAGAEETGGRIVEQQMEDLRRTAPYERQFTDIDSGRGAVEWLVANFAQQGPNMIESIATAGAGFLAGTAATGNPLGGAAAALAATIGKTAWKESVKAALKKKAAGETLDATENQLLRKAAGVGMATAATFGQSLATGASDIYGELRDQGADADDVSARLKALGGSIPYALADTLPEYLLFSRLLGKGARPGLGTLPTGRAKAGEILRRGAVGGAVGGGAEGLGELTQEALLLGLSDQDFGSTENINRLINSFAAGAGVGGPVGAGANIFNPTNLLKPGEKTDPSASAPKVQPTPKTELTVPGTQLTVQPRPEFAGTYGQGAGTFMSGAGGTYMPSDSRELVPGYAPTTPLGAAPGAPLQLPPPVQTLTPVGGPVIMAGMGPGAADVTRQDVLLRQQGNVPPGAAPGSQGVLDVFGGTIPAQELSARMQPQAPLPGLPPPVTAPVADARQGALQFAGEAPTLPANTQMQNQLQVIQDRRRRQQEFEAAQAQQAALIQQQTEALAQQSANARDLFAMQQGQPPAPFPSRPMVTVQPTQPRQLPLFTRKQAPVPPKAGQLRRGGRMQPAAAPTEDRGLRQATLQAPMFGATGEPTLPALRAAGTTTKVAPPAPKPRATKTAGARGLKKGAKVAEVNVVEAERPEVAAQRATLEKLLPKEAGNLKLEKITAYAGNWRVSYITADGRSGSSMPVDAEDLVGKTDSEIKVTLADRARKNGLKGVADALEKRNLKQGRVAERQQDNAGVQGGGDAGEKPATEVKTGGAQAGGGGKPVVSGKKAPEQPLTTAKAQELLDDLGIDPDTTKAKVMALAKRMRDANLLDDGDINSLSRISKDRDMGPEDLISELQSSLNIAATEEIAPPKKAEAAVAAAPQVAEGPIPLTLTQADGTKLKVKDGQKLVDKLDSDIKKLDDLLVCLRAL